MSNKIASIQGLRTLLFLCILLFHCGTPLFSIGWGGGKYLLDFNIISAYQEPSL